MLVGTLVLVFAGLVFTWSQLSLWRRRGFRNALQSGNGSYTLWGRLKHLLNIGEIGTLRWYLQPIFVSINLIAYLCWLVAALWLAIGIQLTVSVVASELVGFPELLDIGVFQATQNLASSNSDGGSVFNFWIERTTFAVDWLRSLPLLLYENPHNQSRGLQVTLFYLAAGMAYLASVLLQSFCRLACRVRFLRLSAISTSNRKLLVRIYQNQNKMRKHGSKGSKLLWLIRLLFSYKWSRHHFVDTILDEFASRSDLQLEAHNNHPKARGSF